MTTGLVTAPAYETGPRAPLWEQAVLFVWFTATIGNMPFQTPFLYACVLYFLIRFAIDYQTYVALAARIWPILLLALWGLASLTWTPFVGAAIQTVIYQVLTFVIIMVIAERYQLDQIFRIALMAGFMMLMVYLTLGGPDSILPYAHKNPRSLHTNLVLILALWSIIDKSQPIWLKAAAAISVPVCAMIVLEAESATGLVLMFVGVAALLASTFFWTSAARVQHLRLMIALMAGAAVVLSVLILMRLPLGQIISDFLLMLGKDSSLTGRTDLWKYADEISDQHPLFGVGVDGFWQTSVGAAESIKIDFYKGVEDRFNFHNAFLEVRVHLGYVGLFLFVFALAWTLSRHLRAFAQNARTIDCAAFILALLVLTTTFTESALWGNFNLYMHLFYLPAIAAFGASRRTYIGDATVEFPENDASGRTRVVLAR